MRVFPDLPSSRAMYSPLGFVPVGRSTSRADVRLRNEIRLTILPRNKTTRAPVPGLARRNLAVSARARDPANAGPFNANERKSPHTEFLV